MAKISFQGMRYISSGTKVEQLPALKNVHGKLLPEVAVIGRSNVGKSSLLNTLFQSKGLVKTSATPGKTQALNLFAADENIAFMDLPGYGYAKVNDSVRKQWGPMIQHYLEKRTALLLVLFLFDIRRDPNEEDRQLMHWLIQQNKAIILVITKTDKVNKSQIKSRCKQIVDAFNVENLCVIPTSSLYKEGRLELQKTIIQAILEEQQDEITKDEPHE